MCFNNFKKDLQELEINYDDPLEGLLSCSADDDFSQSKKVYQFSSKGVHQKSFDLLYLV